MRAPRVSLARSRKLSAFFNGRSEIAEKTRVRITVVFRTLQSAFALAETAGVAHAVFRRIVEPLWRGRTAIQIAAILGLQLFFILKNLRPHLVQNGPFLRALAVYDVTEVTDIPFP
jgi:hypothetical protein